MPSVPSARAGAPAARSEEPGLSLWLRFLTFVIRDEPTSLAA